MSRVRAPLAAVAVASVVAAGCQGGATAPRVCVLEEGARAHGAAACTAERSRDAVALRAVRAETASFQVVIEDPGVPLDAITIDAPPFVRAGAEPLPIDVFVEYFVDVLDRTRNGRDAGGALAFTHAARPADRDVLGPTPDALIPLDVAACRDAHAGRGFCPYPLRLEEGARGAFWLDVFVPAEAPPGTYKTRIAVRQKGIELGAIDATLTVAPAVLPYGAARFFAFEAYETLSRFEDPAAVERSLLQLLHAHHVDGFPQVTEGAHVERLAPALDGSLFTAGSKYRGPGVGAPLSILPIGAYGSFGAPTDDAVVRAKRVAAKIPKTTETFLYAIDERCESSRGADWIKELERIYVGDRLKVAQTCDRDPIDQRVDVVLTTTAAFDREKAATARKPVYAYNGRLPFAGPLMLDAPLTSLTANGWLAARYGVPRWFLWETTFWDDGNAGGEGPHDVFVDPETFHNADGDVALYDGMLVYPGRSPWITDLATDAVLPSMRLKALRRGIEDAGLVALAASRDLARTREVVARVASGGMTDARADAPTRFATTAEAFAEARAELRAIIADADLALDQADAASQLAAIPQAKPRAIAGGIGAAFIYVAAGVLLALAAAVVRIAQRRVDARR